MVAMAVIHTAQAGLMMITVYRATPDTMGESPSDIESEGVRDRSEPDHFNLYAESDVVEEDLPKKSSCSSMNSISTHS